MRFSGCARGCVGRVWLEGHRFSHRASYQVGVPLNPRSSLYPRQWKTASWPHRRCLPLYIAEFFRYNPRCTPRTSKLFLVFADCTFLVTLCLSIDAGNRDPGRADPVWNAKPYLFTFALQGCYLIMPQAFGGDRPPRRRRLHADGRQVNSHRAAGWRPGRAGLFSCSGLLKIIIMCNAIILYKAALRLASGRCGVAWEKDAA